MTDERAAEVLRPLFDGAERKRRKRMATLGWLSLGMAVLWALVWGVALAIDKGQL